MKKLFILVVLALTLTASMAGAWTDYLVAPDDGGSVYPYYALELDYSAILNGNQWNYVYTLTNLAGASGLNNYTQPIDRFTLSLPSNLKISDINVNVVPTNWTWGIEDSIVWWDAPAAGDRIAPGNSAQFGFWSYLGPQQITSAAAINHRSFNGNTYVPTPVPEASTMVGFGSALLMAGPGMIGWIRRRRS